MGRKRAPTLSRVVGLLVLLGVARPAWGDDGIACREQAAAAERQHGIPAGLLLAIGRRESGRADAQSGEVLPWPWSVNREGQDHVFATAAEAVDYVAGAQRDGSSSIDVGCFQINLKYHPDAFASLTEAFDPAANAAYAARFLAELHDREGNWEAAVADYHSATPELGGPYRDAVLATWRGGPLPISAALALRPPRTAPAGNLSGGLTGPTRIAFGVRIWEPTPPPPQTQGGPAAVAAAQGQPRLVKLRFAPRRGLPRVITPGSPR